MLTKHECNLTLSIFIFYTVKYVLNYALCNYVIYLKCSSAGRWLYLCSLSTVLFCCPRTPHDLCGTNGLNASVSEYI